MLDSDLDRYFADQSAPRRSAVFDITFDRLVKETGIKLADIMTNEKLYNRILGQTRKRTIAMYSATMPKRIAAADGSSKASR
jgi:hypothetical protein